MQGKPIVTAAAAANMSERSARRWREGETPSQKKNPRHWRTRPDPFAGVWEAEIELLLAADRERVLQAPTILEWLQDAHPDRFADSQLRTLQRRIRDWRALNGPEREVFFPQVHPPGREAQADFSSGGRLGVTIAGQAFPHLLFEFVLSYSGWRHVQIAYSETFMALKSGLQAALWELGGCPRVIRTDNLSAATHELRRRRGRDLNWTYRQLLTALRAGVDPLQPPQGARERGRRAGPSPDQGGRRPAAGAARVQRLCQRCRLRGVPGGDRRRAQPARGAEGPD